MAWKLRAALAIACLLAVVGLIVYGRTSSNTPRQAPAASLAASNENRNCRSCHPAVWEEWQASQHAASWTSPNVQAAFQHFGHDRQCESCHAPEPVAALAAESPVALRSQDRDSGVNCLSCHALPGGNAVAATRTVSDAPCRPVQTSLLSDSRHCAACHTAIFKDWSESRYRTEGKTCQICHMPTVKQRSGGRSHLCLGGHSDELVRSGVVVRCRQEGDELIVAVSNHATGHNYPGERHNRVLLLEVIQRGPDGEITLARQATIKNIAPFRGESSADLIQVDETFESRFPVAARPSTADVKLLYKRFPWHADRDALVVYQEEVALPKSPPN